MHTHQHTHKIKILVLYRYECNCAPQTCAWPQDRSCSKLYSNK